VRKTNEHIDAAADGLLTGAVSAAHVDRGGLVAAMTELARVGPETPTRMAAALLELMDGYGDDPARHVKVFDAGPDPGIVVVSGMPFASLCEHHVLPFTGTADVAYLPTHSIIGLSKIPRMLRALSRRLQVQERIGQQLADAMHLSHELSPAGVMVVLHGRHTCMSLRGAETPGVMVTSCVRGVFASDPAARAEAMALMGAR
jgi:GTP cyclohydrolase I